MIKKKKFCSGFLNIYTTNCKLSEFCFHIEVIIIDVKFLKCMTGLFSDEHGRFPKS